ncbi:phage tail sheath protein [Myxococcus sp. CA051A]|uniref:phage tail sheath protein n=1 Tax=unclassified Myxococcus TaxID=2648731 RepID=UPI00157A2852|nr:MULTISPECIES: phage tail sheath protein [unclassified Myxococcus]NTX06654.1 phage tail sheath protein [Myxococcus sp. CA040A]NTX67255.1 phage tail sheath protein [Myxococcus sp. CA051A]
MSGLVFEVNTRAPVSAPERADLACFVGFVRRTPGTPVPRDIQQWLVEHGWSTAPLSDLENVPVPIERWSDFARLFAWEGTYLGAAVRSFFTQGGRKCYVVRAGNPWPDQAPRAERAALAQKLLPGTGALFDASPHERGTWKGAAHLLGLDDVSFLCMPDLAALFAVDEDPLPPPVTPPSSPEVFVECSTPAPTPGDQQLSTRPTPRADAEGYTRWANFLMRVKALLSRHVREVQLVAAIPLPHPDAVAHAHGRDWVAEENAYTFLLATGHLRLIESAFVQLVYPWARTPGSARLPGALESPEGLLAGVLARGALLRGTFRSALNAALADVDELFPLLDRSALTQRPLAGWGEGPDKPWLERVSLLGHTAGGLRLLSDVTTSPSESWRQAGVNRLLSVLIRASRRAGVRTLFEPSAERTWRELVYRIEGLLVRLWEAGALRGTSPREAFRVRCDRTTMTQDDLDAGRLVAEVEFDAAAALERIHVVLTMAEEGVLSLSPEGAA